MRVNCRKNVVRIQVLIQEIFLQTFNCSLANIGPLPMMFKYLIVLSNDA